MQSAAQLKRQLHRRKVKRRKQASDSGVPLEGEAEDEDEDLAELRAADCYVPLTHLRAAHKLDSFAFMPRQKAATMKAAADVDDGINAVGSVSASVGRRGLAAMLLVADRSNAITLHACELRQGGSSSIIASVQAAGHRTEPRALAMSVDEKLLLTAADGEAKVWSVRSRQCVGTLGCGYGLSAVFLLANKCRSPSRALAQAPRSLIRWSGALHP